MRYAHQLPPVLLEDLVFRMGQCSMTESARNLARAVAAAAPSAGGASAGLQDPGVAALLAALVGGRQATAVQGTLQASHTALGTPIDFVARAALPITCCASA